MKNDHSPCIMDDYGSQVTHWVCCNHDKARKTIEYFDSFGLPPDEWDKNTSLKGFKAFKMNNNQIQNINSVRCSYYCLLFLNERTRGTSFREIMDMFTKYTKTNERLVRK